MDAPTAVVVAGGRGTRLQPLTHDRPKPLVEFCGEPFLAGVLRRLAGAGVTRLLLVVGADPGPFEVLRPLADDLGVELRAVPEPRPLDTAGGVRAAVDLLDGSTLVCNGDVLTDVPFAEVAATHAASGADASIVLTRVEDTSAFGVCVTDGDRIVDFVEKPAPGSLPGHDTVNAGTYVLEPEVLRRHPEGPLSFERQVFPGLVAAGGHLGGIVHEGAWADLGTPERYRAGHRAVLDGELAWPSVEAVPDRGDGVRVAEGADVAPDARLVAPVLVLDGAVVGSGAVVGPHVVVGRGAHVGAGCRLDDSVLGSATVLGADVRASGLVTGVAAVLADGTTAEGDAVVGDHEQVAGDLGHGARRPPPVG